MMPFNTTFPFLWNWHVILICLIVTAWLIWVLINLCMVCIVILWFYFVRDGFFAELCGWRWRQLGIWLLSFVNALPQLNNLFLWKQLHCCRLLFNEESYRSNNIGIRLVRFFLRRFESLFKAGWTLQFYLIFLDLFKYLIMYKLIRLCQCLCVMCFFILCRWNNKP